MAGATHGGGSGADPGRAAGEERALPRGLGGGRAAVLLLVLALAVPIACGDAPADPTPDDPAPGTTDGAAGQEPDEREGVPEYWVGPPGGRWHEPRTNTALEDLTEEQRERIADLEALGYLDGVHEAGDARGLTRSVPELVQPGLNLLTSAHAATALLLDERGEPLHTWRFPFRKAWPDYPGRHKHLSFWRRTHLFDDGRLLAIYEGLGILEVDVDSNLLWKSAVRAHHDMEPMPDGTVWVLTREAHVVPRVHPNRPILEDAISLLGSGGEELDRISILEALEGTPFREHWDGGLGANGDLFHTNSLEVLDGRLAHLGPEFAEGNFLVSMLLLDLIGIVDAQSRKFVWAMTGDFNKQHDPHVLDDGSILLFDNNPAGEASRIVELDPRTGEERWTYEGNPVEPFYSQTCGLAQRLPNGNTLVTESDYGRAFEVTRDGRIVWEFVNPFRAGDEEQFIATMMEMRRLPEDFAPAWLDR